MEVQVEPREALDKITSSQIRQIKPEQIESTFHTDTIGAQRPSIQCL